MEDNILFYDKNSIDCTLAVLINNVLFKYICYPVDSDETNLNEFIPPTGLLAKNYWFIGLKPTNQWITNNQSSAVINIIYKNVDITDYINSQINVNIPITLHTSLAYNFFIRHSQHDFPISAFENHNFQINKIKELLDNFELYTENYRQPILNPKWLSAYFTVCSFSRMFNLNNVSNLIRLMENSEKLVNELTGLLNVQYYKSEINNLISKSKIVNRTNLDKCLLININRKEDIYQIDKYLTEYILNNNLLIDYVEYYVINEDLEIEVYIKKFNMFVSPIEISQEILLIQHIGLQNKSDIYLYLLNNFEIDVLTDTFLKLKTNGLIKYKTTMKKFFNII